MSLHYLQSSLQVALRMYSKYTSKENNIHTYIHSKADNEMELKSKQKPSR